MLSKRKTPSHITPDWTLGQLKTCFPGVELTLFAYFGVGSRERSGFAATERLDDLLRRHLVFDAKEACARLDRMAQEDWAHEVEAGELAAMSAGEVAIVDARGAEDFARCHLEGSELLSASVVTKCKQDPMLPLVLVCADGSQAPAASRHLRGLGLKAHHLRGGLVSWASEVDRSFPILFPLVEVPGCWHFLADAQTLRLRFEARTSLEPRLWYPGDFDQSEEALALVNLVVTSPGAFAVRGSWTDLRSAVKAIESWSRDELKWKTGGRTSSVELERQAITRVLEQEAPKILHAHRGTVEIASYGEDRVLALRLGGGCAGCASANVTTQRELAAALYREVPLIDAIVSQD